MSNPQTMKAFENFIENIWPHVIERFDLPEDMEPTQEEFELWNGHEIDAATDYYPVEDAPMEDEQSA